MNELPYICRKHRGTIGGRPHEGARSRRLAWTLAALCAALTAMPVAAQEKTEPKGTTQGGGSCGGGGAAPDAWSPKGGEEAGQQQAGPRWVCEEPNLSLESIWRGDQIACSWLIKNGGDEVLRIQAKGG